MKEFAFHAETRLPRGRDEVFSSRPDFSPKISRPDSRSRWRLAGLNQADPVVSPAGGDTAVDKIHHLGPVACRISAARKAALEGRPSRARQIHRIRRATTFTPKME
jgi:hypothetical protein